MREQAMSAGDIDNPAAATAAPNPPCHFPGLEQFFAWQASDAADDAANPVEQPVAREATNIMVCESAFRAVGEAHVFIVARGAPKCALHCRVRKIYPALHTTAAAASNGRR